MLTKKQKNALRTIDFSKCDWKVKGESNNGSNISFVQMKAKTLREILRLGFYSVENANPKEANCLIRLYQKGYCYKSNIYTLYGSQVFTKRFGKWVSKNAMGGQLKLDHSKCMIVKWLSEDECFQVEAEFFDVYLKIR